MSDQISLYCTNCGKKVQFQASLEDFFCAHCGTKLRYQNECLIIVPGTQHEEAAISAILSQQTREAATSASASQQTGESATIKPDTSKPVNRGKQQKARSKSFGCLKRGLFAMCLLFAMAALSLMMPGIPKVLATVASIIEGLAVAGLVTILFSTRRIWFMIIPLVLSVLTFYDLPIVQIREVWVIAFATLTVLATLMTIVVIIWWAFHHRRVVGLTVGLAAILILEVITGVTLNAYADSRTAPAVALIQDYYAEVSVAVEQGNELAAGYQPKGVTFSVVNDEALKAEEGLAALDVPGNLVDYASKVQAWASSVSWAAAGAADRKGLTWKAPSADSFKLEMTTDQVDTVVTTSEQEIANFLEFADFAHSEKNAEGLLWIAARLDAQSYWLKGIGASTDPNWISTHLHFIEPVVYPDADGSVSMVETPMQPIGFRSTPTSASPIKEIAYRLPDSPQDNSSNGCGPSNGQVDCRDFAQKLTSPLDKDISTVRKAEEGELPCIKGGTCMSETPSSTWPPDAMPSLLGNDVNWISEVPSPSPINKFPAPPKSFKQYCDAQGQEITERNEFDMSPDTSRVVTSEDGWVCHMTNQPCWTLLSLSGKSYAGGESGICPQNGLVPQPGGPLGELASFTGSIISGVVKDVGIFPTGPTIYSWDGTYTITHVTQSCPSLGVSAGSGGMGWRVTVVNNTVSGTDAHIDSDGQAEASTSYSGASFRYRYTFTREAGGGAQFTMVEEANTQYTSCTITMIGTRNQ